MNAKHHRFLTLLLIATGTLMFRASLEAQLEARDVLRTSGMLASPLTG